MYVFVHVCMCVCMYASEYVWMCVCMCIYIYIYIFFCCSGNEGLPVTHERCSMPRDLPSEITWNARAAEEGMQKSGCTASSATGGNIEIMRQLGPSPDPLVGLGHGASRIEAKCY